MSSEMTHPILTPIEEQPQLHVSAIQTPIRASSLKSVNEFVNREDENKVAVDKESIQLNS
jgi:hypothetical protein